jgi:hypothetical protein
MRAKDIKVGQHLVWKRGPNDFRDVIVWAEPKEWKKQHPLAPTHFQKATVAYNCFHHDDCLNWEPRTIPINQLLTPEDAATKR